MTTSSNDGTQYLFLTTSKDDLFRWVESITSSKTLDPSPLLLHVTGGAVLHTGFMTCQEFARETKQGARPTVKRKLSDVDLFGTSAAVDYGKHWTVLRSKGLVQCMVKGRPETLLDLAQCQRVRVENPREMREGSKYGIEVECAESRFVLRAEVPTDHCDWVLAVEQVLRKLDRSKLLQGHRKRESGYVALKRLLLTSAGQQEEGAGSGGHVSQLYCFPRISDDMEDIYDPPVAPPPPTPREHVGPRSELLQKPKEELPLPPAQDTPPEDNVMPLPPKDYLPPPLPPRNDDPPPLPPKARPTPAVVQRPTSTVSSGNCSDADEDYVMMQSYSAYSSVPPSPQSAHLSPTTPRGRTISSSSASTQPISIPNRRASKRSVLLRNDSESSSPSHSLRQLHEVGSAATTDLPRKESSSSSFLLRQNSNQSLGSLSYTSVMRQASLSSMGTENPPLPPGRSGEKRSSGYTSPVFYPSPCVGGGSGGRLTQSSTMGGISSHAGHAPTSRGEEDGSRSDGMTVTELRYGNMNGKVPTSSSHKPGRGHTPSISSSYASEGYGSNHSSTEDLEQVSPGMSPETIISILAVMCTVCYTMETLG